MVRPTTSPRGRSAAGPTGGFAFVRVFAAAVTAGAVAIGALMLVEPTRRFGLDPRSTLGFATSLGSTLVLFATAFAVVAPAFDLVAAWVRGTPESERRKSSGEGVDGGHSAGFFESCGFGDGDCGGDGGGGD